MNGLKFCKNVLKYNGNVLSVNFNELKPCLNQNFNTLKVLGHNKILTIKDNITENKETRYNFIILICGVVGSVCAFVMTLREMKDSEIGMDELGPLCCLTLFGGTVGVVCGLVYPIMPVIGCLSILVWLHNKRVRERKNINRM
jgi:hypothetical protein